MAHLRRRLGWYILGLAALLVILSSQAGATSSSILVDDFNSYTAGVIAGQEGWTGFDDFRIQDTVSVEGKALEISGGSGDRNVEKQGASVTEGKVVVYMLKTNSRAGDLTFQLRSAGGTKMTVDWRDTGEIGYLDSSWEFRPLLQGESNTWYLVEISWKAPNSQRIILRKALNTNPMRHSSVLADTGFVGTNSSWTSIDTIRLRAAGSFGQEKGFFDSIGESALPETVLPAPTSTPLPAPIPSPTPTPTSSWNNVSSGDGYMLWANGELELGSSGSSGSYGMADQMTALVPGAEYCLSLDILGGDLSWAALAVSTGRGGNTGRILLVDFRITGPGTYTSCFVPTEPQVWITLISGGGTWWLNNVSMKQAVPAPADPNERTVNSALGENLSGWIDTSFPEGSDGSIAWNAGRMELLSGGQGYGQAEQKVATIPGADYCFSADVVGGNLSWAAIAVGTKQGDQGRIFLLNGLTPRHYELCFTAPSTETWVLVNSGGGTWWIDNVSLKGPAPTLNPQAPAILSPAWYEAFSVAPGQTLSRHVAVQKPAGTTHWCSKTRVNYDGTYPFASDLTVTSGCEITWTPSSTTPLGRYEAGLQVSFQGSMGSVTHYRTFYVDVTNNPPAPDTTPDTNQVLGIQIGTTPWAPIPPLDVTPIPPILVVTSSVTINTYTASVGQALGGSFILQNKASFPIILEELVLGGRLDGVNDCSNYTGGACPDFTKYQDVVIEPGAYHVYVGSFTPQLSGTYDFQVFYRIVERWYWNIPTENDAVNQRFVEVGEGSTSWEALAQKWATYYSLDSRLLKAVVEAEATQNIAGDYDENGVPHAFGYGQVWPKWHYVSIQQALFDATGSPVSTIDEQTLGNLLLANNDASMAAAALVIRSTWQSVGAPNDFGYNTFEAFTKKYVGPAISTDDLARRWSIWQKYLP